MECGFDLKQFRLAIGDERTLPNGRVEHPTVDDWQRVLEASRRLATSVELTPVASGRPAPGAAAVTTVSKRLGEWVLN